MSVAVIESRGTMTQLLTLATTPRDDGGRNAPYLLFKESMWASVGGRNVAIAAGARVTVVTVNPAAAESALMLRPAPGAFYTRLTAANAVRHNIVLPLTTDTATWVWSAAPAMRAKHAL